MMNATSIEFGINISIHSINPLFTAPRHEEADIRIVHALHNLDRGAKVFIKCDDTDIIVILLGNMHKLKYSSKICVQFGASDHMRNIDVNGIHGKLKADVCKTLPAFHAFTGCDFNPSFYRKSKKYLLKLCVNRQLCKQHPLK